MSTLAYGKTENLTGVKWQDEKVAILTIPANLRSTEIAFSPSERFVVTGEVWLREKLSPFNHSASDLQIIAHAWEQWGVETLTKLVGMFTLMVWDRQKQVLYLARDPVGSRTIYYTRQGNIYYLASDMRSLSPYHSRYLDLVALRDYLCCAFVPGSRTMWQDVSELRPGTVLTLPDERIETYWSLQESIKDYPLEWHSKKLRNLLEEAVQDSLPQQEAVGVFLSGGLDSSTITALACKLHSEPIHTYSIHFGKTCPNELEFSGLIAQQYKTKHHILEITFDQMWKRLPETIGYLDDPIGDPLTVPNLLLGKLAAESIGVVLNGEGGDPCFGGPKNQPMLINQLYGEMSGYDQLQAYLISFKKCASDLPQLLKAEIWDKVQNEPYIFSEELDSTASYLNRLMSLNIKYKGADQILTKVNNLTKAVGLQGRSPLFDAKVVELSMQIPPHYKLSGVQEKAVLKQAVADLLPEKILNRPKSGMMVPVQLGFRSHWQKQAKALLLNRHAVISPYLNQSVIKDWLNYQGDTWDRYGVKLWLLTSLEYWLQTH